MPNIKHSLRYIVSRYDSNGRLSILHRASLHPFPMKPNILSKHVDLNLFSDSQNTISAMENSATRNSAPYKSRTNRECSGAATSSANVASKKKEKCPHCTCEITIGNMAKHISGHTRRSGFATKYCQWCAYQTTIETDLKLHFEESHGRCPFCRRKPSGNVNEMMHYHKITCPKRCSPRK